MASGDTKTEALLNVLGNGGSIEGITGCCNTKTQNYIIDAINRIQNVENEVAEIINNPDVVDIVNTYADLQAYDTQHLGDKAVIRVLNDETHDGHSTYYRYDKTAGTWTYIGEDSGGGNTPQFIELTADDYDYPTNNPNKVAAWKLAPGFYTTNEASLTIGPNTSGSYNLLTGQSLIVFGQGSGTKLITRTSFTGSQPWNWDYVSSSNGSLYQTVTIPTGVENGLTSVSNTQALAANQGRVLNEKINSISNYSTSEVNTGATWINGKTIYKKTVNTGALPNATTNNIAHGITNLDRIIKIEGWAYRSEDTSFFPLPSTSTGSVSANIVTTANSTYVNISTGTDRSNVGESYVTLYYTKTS